MHKTISGHFVRSKSEELIAMILFQNRIPFHYEECLVLGDTEIFPDFTIRHPVTGRYYYWEHFGMMDKEKYSKNVASKLGLYISNGIIPNLHMITTYETNTSPLSSEVVDKIVEQYFL